MISFKSYDYWSFLDKHCMTGAPDRVFASGSPAPFSVGASFIDSGFTCTVTQQFHPHLSFSLIRAGNIRAGCQVAPLPERSFCLWFSPASWEFKVWFHGILKQYGPGLLWSCPLPLGLTVKAFTPPSTEISWFQTMYLAYIERDAVVVYLQGCNVFSLCF